MEYENNFRITNQKEGGMLNDREHDRRVVFETEQGKKAFLLVEMMKKFATLYSSYLIFSIIGGVVDCSYSMIVSVPRGFY
jgi:hypothetical protein